MRTIEASDVYDNDIAPALENLSALAHAKHLPQTSIDIATAVILGRAAQHYADKDTSIRF